MGSIHRRSTRETHYLHLLETVHGYFQENIARTKNRVERSYEKGREERAHLTVQELLRSPPLYPLLLFPSSRVCMLLRYGRNEEEPRDSGEDQDLCSPSRSLSLSLSPSPSLYLGEDDRRVKEKRRRRRGARERVGCRWWGKKQKSSRSWSGPGWSQAIRDHPESRGVQLGSRQSGAVGMRPSGEKNKTNFYALVLPSPFFSAFSFAFAPLSLCLSLPSSSLALPLVVSRPPREKH